MKTTHSISALAGSWVCDGCRRSLARQSQLRTRISNSTRRHSTAPSRKDAQKLPESPARTRFAPSPTGFMHLGSLRTALFNFLLARATKGQFLLRIEDTDTKRTVPGALERICRDLEWAGLQWDEGPEVGGPYGPYLQSERTSLYREHADKLLNSGHAYRCFCTAERLNELTQARAKMGLPTDYDRTCASIAKEESDDRAHKGERHTIRLKVPQVYPEYFDLVYGRVGKAQRSGSTRKHGETVYEDPILLKSDGFPTYHLANVVDDHLMKITHVVRAAEWMPSTPKHLALYEAFGWRAPSFAHVGLLQDASGNKLSKRNADIDVASYKNKGYFPEALSNFCALLGWSHTRGDDFMTMQDLINTFDLKFTKGNTLVSFKKLDFLQRHHTQRYIEQQGNVFAGLVDEIMELLQKRKAEDPSWTVQVGKDERAYVSALLSADAKKFVSPQQFLDSNRTFFTQTFKRLDEAQELEVTTTVSLKDQLEAIPEGQWTSETIADVIQMVTAEHVNGQGSPQPEQDLKKVGVMVNRYLRWAILSSPGPPMALSMAILGKQTSLTRLNSVQSSD